MQKKRTKVDEDSPPTPRDNDIEEEGDTELKHKVSRITSSF
jgi:hypothetical protein